MSMGVPPARQITIHNVRLLGGCQHFTRQFNEAAGREGEGERAGDAPFLRPLRRLCSVPDMVLVPLSLKQVHTTTAARQPLAGVPVCACVCLLFTYLYCACVNLPKPLTMALLEL